MRASWPLLLVLAGCPTPYIPTDSDTDLTDSGPVGDCPISVLDESSDVDGDGISDNDEVNGTTDPCEWDSDGDGQPDGFEANNGSDPNSADSKISGNVVVLADGEATDLEVVFHVQITRADIAFLIDTTCSMGSLTNAMANEFSGIVSELSAVLPDATYGVATYDDFAYPDFGSGAEGDRPFILRQQQTSDITLVQDALANKVVLHNGLDLPESGMEALFQMAAGLGWDQDCNGAYDDTTDVKPFRAIGGDAFAGQVDGSFDPTVVGGGSTGGMGFRRGTLPILVYGTDAQLRDKAAGMPVPVVSTSCGAQPASSTDVVQAVNGMGGRLVAVDVDNRGSPGRSQMQDLAYATNSLADLNGNGIDEPIIVQWNGASSAAFRISVSNAIKDLVGALSFGQVAVDPRGNGASFVGGTTPELYANITSADLANPISFTVQLVGASPATAVDQVFTAELVLQGDGAVDLAKESITILVRGTGTNP